MGGPQESSSERVAQDVLDSLLEGCQVISFDFRYLYVNDAALLQSKKSKSELLNRTMMECFPGIESTPMFGVLRRCMTSRLRDRLENQFEYPDGSGGWFELRFIPVPEGLCILSLDITEGKRTSAALARSEEHLRHAQKMEAVGRLAGGVAHDFNNLLSVILSYSSILLRELGPGERMRDDLEEIRNAGERAAALTRQLLAFSRQQVLAPQLLDLNEVLSSLDKVVGTLVGENIEVLTLPGVALWPVRADPGQLEQVLMNFVVNARDAMPRGGKLTIETQNVELDAYHAEQHLGLSPGPHVMLAVSDTGVGMNKETVERIFEPFFTTKEKGKGTGLGLATVFGIVQQSGGGIRVSSEPGEGTTFKVYLPRSDEVDSVLRLPPAQGGSLLGSEVVLLVEDDEQVRTVTRGILTRSGYGVLEARNGGEALRLSEQHEGTIHLLASDVVMPGMSGAEVAARLISSRPGMKVLLLSGYTEDVASQRRAGSPGVAFLQKPITPDALLRKVREVLESKEPALFERGVLR